MAGLNLMDEYISRPAVLRGRGDIVQAGRFISDLLQQRQVVVPGDLCKRRLHKRRIGVSFRKAPHILEVARRQPFHRRKLAAQFGRELVNNLRAPALHLLLGENELANVPIEHE